VFGQADYPTLELYTLAQCCVSWIGESKLGEALRSGIDPHLLFASQMLSITYEEAVANKKRADVKKSRQLAKAANFGFPGGMGAKKFVAATRKQILSQEDKVKAKAEWEELGLTEERAQQLKAQWFEAWPELPHYFARINALCDNDSGRASVESLATRRFRGGATYCSACNSGFQGLASDIAKRALWLVAEEQYVHDPLAPSLLYGTRTVAFVHDELIIEVDDDEHAHDAAQRLAEVMCTAANEYLPDVPMARSKLEPLLMRRWSKNAEPCVDAGGRLVPWG
jgi:DNA polymerase-1